MTTNGTNDGSHDGTHNGTHDGSRSDQHGAAQHGTAQHGDHNPDRPDPDRLAGAGAGSLDRLIGFCLENKLIVGLGLVIAIGWGLMVAPFDWDLSGLPRDPVPVDAIPDIGENQQIVFTEWMGRSPQDVEDQISYPLTVSLLGIPGVKTIRSYSMMGFSTIYVIFEDGIEFYWSRSRILEKLSSLPAGLLPPGVQPTLGPDATALGQVFWYTLEGQDQNGRPTGGWGLDELRSIQDWQVRCAVMAAEGVSEVASVGGFVREYQIDVDPDAMRAAGVTLPQVIAAVQRSNKDVGARTIEVNQAEYVVRGLGFVESIEDLERAVVAVRDNVPIDVGQVAHVSEGPALRRGALDKQGAEVVGGVAVVRYGENPLSTIQNVKAKIAEIAPGLPRKTLADGTVSQVRIVPFYDRSGLIYETLGTLRSALSQQILVTILVILLMLVRLRSSMLVSGLLPAAVLICFIAMKQFGVDANIVALSGIAIAIGTLVDMAIILVENIVRRLDEAPAGARPMRVTYDAAREVGGAVLTAVATTVISFLPVFTMTGAEGKLFQPLAFTKTFALFASVLVALTVLPAATHLLFGLRRPGRVFRVVFYSALALVAAAVLVLVSWWAGAIMLVLAAYGYWGPVAPPRISRWSTRVAVAVTVLGVAVLLAQQWTPLGPERNLAVNLLFVGLLVASWMLFFAAFYRAYPRLLTWSLRHKAAAMSLPVLIVLFGGLTWLGFERTLGWLPTKVKTWGPVSTFAHAFPGLGKEFMPPLDEGAYLLMPTTMPHASIGEVLDVLQKQDLAITQIPEVSSAVGKLGRVESALDPAPVSMIETLINYHPEYLQDGTGHRLRFRYDAAETDTVRSVTGAPLPAPDGEPYVARGRFSRDDEGALIADPDGTPFRLWRPALDPALNPGRDAWAGIEAPDDIWNEIVAAAKVPGTTSAPKLQPISTRLVMLQSGMRAPMGIKVKGPDLETIEQVGIEIEQFLKEVPQVNAASVFADRIVGKPYLEIDIDRERIARYGLHVEQVQDVIEVAIGGRQVTMTVEGRERYGVRVRYQRELRDRIESLGQILVPAPGGVQIPLDQLATIRYVRGPQVIKSEDTFLVGYVLFDRRPGVAEVEAVEAARDYLEHLRETGAFEIPAGVSYAFAGSYENQVHAEKKLMVILPLALLLILIILYLQFRRLSSALLVFSGVAVAWGGGFLMLWLYGQSWFLDVHVLGASMRELFQIDPVNLSVAVWVGFLALFGIATDDGVVIATYLRQSYARHRPRTVDEVRAATVEAARRRSRPCLMTTATTLLALLPVLTSTGRGSDVMVPMAIPTFGGMTVAVVTMFVVPVLSSAIRERAARKQAAA